MSLWTRVRNVFRRDRLNAELDEEMEAHLEEAVARGRSREEARRDFGSPLRAREESRDARVSAWLDGLRSDFVFGARQLRKHKLASLAALVSLTLAVGACVASFQLIDALLLRPLPVKDPERLLVFSWSYTDEQGKQEFSESTTYPLFRLLRAAVKGHAELMAITPSDQGDLTYASDAEMEQAYQQQVSGWMFETLGLRPAAGRLLTERDDVTPGGHPVAVLSYDYWRRRFGGDPKVVGKKFTLGLDVHEIVGVAPEGFTGTETGSPTDFFRPVMMNKPAIDDPGWSWFRTWVALRPGANAEAVRQRLHGVLRAHREERVKAWPPGAPPRRRDDYVNARVELRPASAGISGAQKTYRQAVAVLAGLVALVLLIACANVANLMAAQAAARAREMAMRVSIGAGRGRLLQLVFAESVLLAMAATLLGLAFAAWASPAVMSRINPPHNPMRLTLLWDGRMALFAFGLTLLVTLLSGLAPALRASGVRPAQALKGGGDPHAKRRLMHALVAAQVAFCFVVHFAAGLFFATFDRLTRQPLGFSPDRVLVLTTVSLQDQPPAFWDQTAERLRGVPGVERVAMSQWGLMSGSGWNSDIFVNGAPPHPVAPNFLGVSPGWFDTMKIELLAGRDFREEESFPEVAIVNQTFARKYFDGRDPVGQWFEKDEGGQRVRLRIVGLVRDARYRSMRDAIPATAYVPFHRLDSQGVRKKKDFGRYVVRTRAENPLALAAALRNEVPRGRPEFRVNDIRTQQQLVDQHTVRERLLATLGGFFALVALVLAAVGLYGVLDYSVYRRRREIGIRMALGARPAGLAWRVSTEIFGALLVGASVGLAMGWMSERYLETLLFGVKARDWTMLTAPVATIGLAAVVAAALPLLRAIRIDPARMLRAE